MPEPPTCMFEDGEDSMNEMPQRIGPSRHQAAAVPPLLRYFPIVCSPCRQGLIRHYGPKAQADPSPPLAKQPMP
ncbi:hypothetical protein GCM10010339_84300 [Streptomyces alanosinicus]|uniref:Uncharacterized protein n=1 Tax=Streptomyces alanosinicus TaxID=68171 RepID=A0A919D829_9ACTN|nr:hypothetical protein GCM10010339_84300 [Streptomyces alanosinicus]